MSVMRHRSLGQTLAESVKCLFLMFSETLRCKFGFGASQVNLQPLVRKTLMKMIRHLISYREKQQEKERKETFWLIDNTCLTQTNQTSCPPAGNHQQRSFVLKILGSFPFAEREKLHHSLFSERWFPQYDVLVTCWPLSLNTVWPVFTSPPAWGFNLAAVSSSDTNVVKYEPMMEKSCTHTKYS